MPWYRTALYYILRPFYRWVLARIDPRDPWAASTSWIPLMALGSGAKRHFGWYLEGDTQVHPDTVEGICDWLAGCQYAHDHDLFHERDFWQHPKTFEHLRKGDCEDFAIWAWRRLIELGIDAHFFIGQWGPDPGRHAWVVFSHEGRKLLLEPQAPRERMLMTFEAAKADYVPYFFVDRACKPVALEGYLLFLKQRDLGAGRDRHAA